ncbi:DUF624 domain-containing protein [Clostridium sp. AL.422]|uniref:YesL family protein n=1 Tax=Clostridium TaxID=1485 RepID=UPI00293DCC2D|nr:MULTISPECIES: DUF624 domain-containing protein [unclassified Clostridium]MDV4149804.1 DUF624 domain-containing protein [Clostridium sp. AL.422]
MGTFFSLDNMLFRFMGRLSDLIILNFLWIIFSLPIFTIGASTKALYSVLFDLADNCEGHITKDFFNNFKKEFRKSTLLWSIVFAFTLILSVNMVFWPRFQFALGYIATIATIFLLIIFLIVSPYIFPIISKYNLNIKEILKLSFILSMKYLHYSIIIILSGILLISINIIFPLSILFTIFIGISLYCFLSCYIFNIVFKKYSL